MESDTQVVGSDGNNQVQVSAAVLLIVGEPATADHKNLILAEITKGFRCWDCDDVDINDELAQIANAAELGVEGPDAERVLNHGTDKMATMIVVNPHLETLTAALKNFLSLSSPYKHLIYAGHYFSGNGSWVLQDDTFSISNFAQMCKDKELEESMKQQNGGQVNFCFGKEGEWKAESLKKLEIFKSAVVHVCSDEKVHNTHGIVQFTAYIANFINAKTSEDLLRTSDVVGSIRFNKPTLYIFPGSEGDSSLFGVSGFNLLINGGYSRKACFWDLTRHLDRIDAFLMTHLGSDNVFGISTLLKRKITEYIHPQIGYMYLNGSDKVSHSAIVNSEKKASLCINLSEEGSKLFEYAKELGHIPQPCTRPMSTQPLQPINLYHKVGHGSLNMYVLNPVSDSKELKEFYQHWNKHLSEHGSLHQIPIQNQLSVCTLLLWQPADPNEKISRIFFPGNAPQYKILEGLEKLKHLDILKHVSCTAKDLEQKPASAAAKRNSLASRPAPSKAPTKSADPSRATKPVSDVKRTQTADVRASTDRKKIEPKKEEAKAQPHKPKTPMSSSMTSKSNKGAKEDENRKTAKKDDKAARPAKTHPAPSKTTPRTKTETKKETPSKAAKEKVEEKVKEKDPKMEEKKDVTEDVPKVDEPPVAVVEPMAEKPLLDLSPNEPVADADVIGGTENADNKQISPEPLPTPADEDNQSDTSPQDEDLMGMGSGMSSKMMESFHEGYNVDLMSNGTPTEEQGENLNNFGGYDQNIDVTPEAEHLNTFGGHKNNFDVPQGEENGNNFGGHGHKVDVTPEGEQLNNYGGQDHDFEVKPEGLPEPVEYPLQETFSTQDMMPSTEQDEHHNKFGELAPEVDVMPKTEPQNIFGIHDHNVELKPEGELLNNVGGPEHSVEVTPKDDQLTDFRRHDHDVEVTPEDEQLNNFEEHDNDMGIAPEGEELSNFGGHDHDVEGTPEDEPLKTVREPGYEVEVTPEDEQLNSFGSHNNDVELKPEGEQLDNFGTHDRDMEVTPEDEPVNNFEEPSHEREVTPEDDQLNSFGGHDNDVELKTGGEQFNNFGGQDHEVEDTPEDEPMNKFGEPVHEVQVTPEDEQPNSFGSHDADVELKPEGDQLNTFEGHDKDVDVITEDKHLNDFGGHGHNIEDMPQVEHQNDFGGHGHNIEDMPQVEHQNNFGGLDRNVEDKPLISGMAPLEPDVDEQEALQEQYNDSLELSNIPEAFEKDETPDPREVQSSIEKDISEPVPVKPVETIDPYDPFCSTSPNMPTMQSSDPFTNYQEVLAANPFDPEAEWGKPMGLPSPPPPDSKESPGEKSSAKKPTTKNGVNKKDLTVPSKAKAKLDTSVNGASTKLNTSRTRPTSATEPKVKPPSTGKRPASVIGSTRAAPATKTPPLPPFTPFYVDLTYIPNHGNPLYSDIEFFKRVRARYYVLSSLSPNPQTLTALMEAKETWDNKNTEVTLIPTYENDTLRHWMGLNRDKLNELKIDVAPSANRCTIHLQDHETSCSAYRLEF